MKFGFKMVRPVAVGALVTTVVACLLIIIQALLDYRELEVVEYPAATLEGTFKAFASIMFAFAGASTFPTIQADMKHKDQFKISAVIACTSTMILTKQQFS
jgi:vesicular inhibitory amino acid transporter